MDARFGSVGECVGQVGVLARDQHGCRFLQRKFDEEGVEAVDLCFDEIIAEVVELMMDPFGNYLVQKLLECCSDEQRMGVLSAVAQVRGEDDAAAAKEGAASASKDADKDTEDNGSGAVAARVDESKIGGGARRGSGDRGSKEPGDGMPELVSVALNTHGTLNPKP